MCARERLNLARLQNPLFLTDKEEPFVFETKKALHLTDEEESSFPIILWVGTPILRPSFPPFKDRKKVFLCSDAMVFHSWKVLDSTPSKKHVGVFLKGMKDPWNIGQHSLSCGKFYLGDLSLGRVWFLWFDHVHLQTDSFPKGRPFKGWNGRLFLGFHSRSSLQKLTKRGHRSKRRYLKYPFWKETGVEGIEPSHVGTKNRCLTTWLYSSL